MAKPARMRYPAQALAELKKDDPDTPITLNFIRNLVKRGLIPSIKVGRGYLINYNALLDYLFALTDVGAQRTVGIRQIEE